MTVTWLKRASKPAAGTEAAAQDVAAGIIAAIEAGGEKVARDC